VIAASAGDIAALLAGVIAASAGDIAALLAGVIAASAGDVPTLLTGGSIITGAAGSCWPRLSPSRRPPMRALKRRPAEDA
jgi:hypothetical protein